MPIRIFNGMEVLCKVRKGSPGLSNALGLGARSEGRAPRIMMSATGEATSSNFGFLAKSYPQLERGGVLAERYFSDDPIVSLIAMRQFGEALAQLVAARSGLFTDSNEPQADLLRY